MEIKSNAKLIKYYEIFNCQMKMPNKTVMEGFEIKQLQTLAVSST